jgi:hypothetical protein
VAFTTIIVEFSFWYRQLGPVRFVSYGRSANVLRIRRTSLMLALFPLEHELPSDFDRLSALRGDRFAAR